MPVCPTVRLDMLRVFPLIEITLLALSCTPLWCQVTVGVGIPSTTQVKETRSFTSFSRSLEGDIVILGGAVCKKKDKNFVLRQIITFIGFLLAPTLNCNGSVTFDEWISTCCKSTAHFKCHTVGSFRYLLITTCIWYRYTGNTSSDR